MTNKALVVTISQVNSKGKATCQNLVFLNTEEGRQFIKENKPTVISIQEAIIQ